MVGLDRNLGIVDNVAIVYLLKIFVLDCLGVSLHLVFFVYQVLQMKRDGVLFYHFTYHESKLSFKLKK